jgi:hypothetical protein
MPQFLPLWWLNLISWLFAILSLQVWFLQATALPHALHLQLARLATLFHFYSYTFDFAICKMGYTIEQGYEPGCNIRVVLLAVSAFIIANFGDQ